MSNEENKKLFAEKLLESEVLELEKTDPEFLEIFDNFALGDVINQIDLDCKTRLTAILASLIGCQGIEEFKVVLPVSLSLGISGEEVKEILYQAAAYLGWGRVRTFLTATNEILENSGAALPLKRRATTTLKDRLERGEQAQIDIFGEHMRGFSKSGSPETMHINKWLTENCFGDFYTREGLDFRQREMITFCFLFAQGGCEPQLISHAKANMRLGNDKVFLIKIVSQCLPYVGYPRSLNALRCVFEAEK